MMKTSPKDPPPSGNPFEPTSPEDPFGALSEYDTCPRSPAESPFEASVETPSGPSFGECHVSQQPARKPSLRKPPSKRLRNMPRVPKVKPKAPFEICFMFRSPAESHPLRNLLRNLLRSYLRKVPPVPSAERKTSPPGYFPSPPRVPECPKPGESLRMPPEPARVSPDDLRMRHVSRAVNHPGIARQPRESSPEEPPPGTRRVRHVSRPLFLPHRIPEKSNKMFGTSKIHRNSSINQKNPKLIFSVSY